MAKEEKRTLNEENSKNELLEKHRNCYTSAIRRWRVTAERKYNSTIFTIIHRICQHVYVARTRSIYLVRK